MGKDLSFQTLNHKHCLKNEQSPCGTGTRISRSKKTIEQVQKDAFTSSQFLNFKIFETQESITPYNNTYK